MFLGEATLERVGRKTCADYLLLRRDAAARLSGLMRLQFLRGCYRNNKLANLLLAITLFSWWAWLARRNYAFLLLRSTMKEEEMWRQPR